MDVSFYGVIEGFFGRPWSWEVRRGYADFLKENGYTFYIYAPKEDSILRENWEDDWAADFGQELHRLGAHYRSRGLEWGIGLSPYEAYLNFDEEKRGALKNKIASINRYDPDILCVLFDDMKGDVPKLAEIQVGIFRAIMDLSNARRFILCPTYYSFDPILEKEYGNMPDHYLEDLAGRLDPRAHIFWTGPKVLSKEYSPSHLRKVTDLLGRKPFIWDNYPVNDGTRMSRYLHLRAFENRTQEMKRLTAGHAVNPMNQAWLSRIPLKTLEISVREGTAYDSRAAFQEAVEALCGPQLATALCEDLSAFQDEGLDGLDEKQKEALVQKYQGFDSPYAEEVVSWLKGEYAFDPDCLTN